MDGVFFGGFDKGDQAPYTRLRRLEEAPYAHVPIEQRAARVECPALPRSKSHPLWPARLIHLPALRCSQTIKFLPEWAISLLFKSRDCGNNKIRFLPEERFPSGDPLPPTIKCLPELII